MFTSLPTATATASSHSIMMTATAATAATVTATATNANSTSMTRVIHDGSNDDLAMFAPAGMARVTFEQAMRALGEYKATYPHPSHQPHPHQPQQQAQQQALPPPQYQQPYQQPPHQPHPPSYQPLPSPHITAIKRGIHGEIHLFGGVTVYPGCDPTVLYQEYLQLNRGQQDAVKRVLRAKDYALILGLPGTGEANLLNHEANTNNT